MPATRDARLIYIDDELWEDAMVEIIDILGEEHRNIEKLLRVMEQELSVFDRGERPDYEVFGAVIEFFKKYPDSCHHPKEDIIYEKFKTRDPDRTASIADLQAEHREGAVRLRRVAQAIDAVLNDQEVLRESVDRIVRDFIEDERRHIALEDEVIFPAIVDTLQLDEFSDDEQPIDRSKRSIGPRIGVCLSRLG
jgi:hemerythrin-like domain-containing protein